MGILIKEESEHFDLVYNNSSFINNKLIKILRKYSELNQKIIITKERLAENNKIKEQYNSNLKQLILEQRQIHTKTQQLFVKKRNFYEELQKDYDIHELAGLNKELNKLLKQEETNDSKISQVLAHIRLVVRAINKYSNELSVLENEVDTIKSLVSTEYQKTNWNEIKHSRIVLSNSFEINAIAIP